MSIGLQKARFMLLLRQYEAEEEAAHRHAGWQTRFAKTIGTRQSSISGLFRDRSPGPKLVEGAITGFNLAREFFTDPKLGASPNYRDFIGKKPARVAGVAESRIDRDPIDESSMDQWTVFTYTDEYKGASEEAKAHAHTLRNQGLDLSVKQYIGVVESLDALRKGKGIPEHKIETPIGETRMRLGRKGR